jgi:hypothetical protein
MLPWGVLWIATSAMQLLEKFLGPTFASEFRLERLWFWGNAYSTKGYRIRSYDVDADKSQ